ncbi:MAG TPA: AMP-binding protein [Thermoanaerobaculia bacterium]|nr:AMP-binding protein [Thermoanaerobaculia bacterium]
MDEILPSGPTAHVDTFCRDSLPPPENWPHMDYGVLPELAAYPSRINAATELLDKRVAAGDGDRPVFHVHGGHWTYRQLLETANRIAHVLVEDLGVVPGNRVLLRGPNNPMMAACWLAVLKVGGVVVCTMPLLRVRELTYIADKAKIRLALTDARVAAECESAMSTTAQGFPREGARVILFHTAEEDSLESLMSGKPATFENCDTAADDPALIAFTSGTTGQGKGTIHFHRDLLAVCDTFAAHVLKADPDDIFCGSPPLAFTYGLGGILLFPLRIGASTLLLEQASPPQLLQGIQEHRATVVFTAPTAYRTMFDLVKGFDISSLRKCVSAGETLPKATFEKWRELTGLGIIDGIGSTEMLHMFISSSGGEIRPGATGRVVPGYEARVVDDDGNEVPPGTIGHLAVRGPTGCRYIDNLERQTTYVRDGWNYPGDSYIMDSEGYFWYQARTDDMIISAGHNISGPEVEAVLLDHPAVAECGVVAAPDEIRGNIVKAYVVLRAGVQGSPELVKKLQDFVKAEIAPYKYPRAIEFVDSLPRTNTGKLQRFRLREMNK